MTEESPIVSRKPDPILTQSSNPSIKRELGLKPPTEDDPIFDTRYQSYARVYIYDLVNADPCDNLNKNQDLNSMKRSVIKINQLYLSRVCICGNIVGIYESQKYYRLKIDDSTGCVSVTLWRDSIFNEYSLDHSNSSGIDDSNAKAQFSELYTLLNSIQTRVKEKSINHSIMYEPKQGDLVLIRANVKCYRQRIELNAVSCIRVQNSTEELIHMILPSCLSNKVYSIKPPSSDEYERIVNKIKAENKNETTEFNKPKLIGTETLSSKDNENFLNFVYKKLSQMASTSVLDSSRKFDQFSNESCESYSLFSFLRNNCPNEFKFVTHKHVLDALKELELRGLVYSCEDEFHYMPLI